MIQVGEKLLLDGKQIKVIIYNDCGGVYVSDNADDEKGIELTYEEAYEYLWLYEKQRADEAEKKWERLKESVKQLEKDINKWYYDSEDVLQELFDIMIKIERGEE